MITSFYDPELMKLDLIYNALQRFLDNTTDMVFVKDINLQYMTASVPFVRMLGKHSLQEIAGRTDFEVCDDPELAKRRNDIDRKVLDEDKDITNYVESLKDDQGNVKYISTSKYILRDDDGQAMGILGISRDITHQYILRQRHEKVLKHLFELPRDTYATVYMDITEWRIIRHQEHAVYGQVIGIDGTIETFAEIALHSLADPNDIAANNFYRNLSRESLINISNSGTRVHSVEYLRRMPSGEIIWCRSDISFLLDPENGHLCAIWAVRNIDRQKQAAMELRHAAEYDELTELLNRASTKKYIQHALLGNPTAIHALLIIDVDNFKSLNDTLGHQAGDNFLATLAKILKGCFREYDVVGRMGGDEFFILMKNIPNASIAIEKAETLLRLTRELCDYYTGLDISISIGISLFPYDGKTYHELYQKADDALYQAKRQSKNQYVLAQDMNPKDE